MEVNMNIIYGFDDELMINFINYLKDNKNLALTTVFKNFAIKVNKSWGTIRNLYYTITKKASVDKDFKNKYLTGVDFCVNKVDKFTSTEEKELVKSIVLERLKTRSTRKAVYNLSGGDDKVALRYQNKFRSAIKNNPTLVSDTIKELDLTEKTPFFQLQKSSDVTLANIDKVKVEINRLVERISYDVKRENILLKNENLKLKEEVEKLKLIIDGLKNGKAVNFFSIDGQNSKLN
jgi:hypothetical protein